MEKTHGRNPEREKEVLRLNAEGKTLAQIGEKLGCTPGTVGYYLYKNKQYKTKGAKKHVNGNGNSGAKNSNHAAPTLEEQQAYATGRIEEILRGYAASSGVPFATFTLGVAESLRATASRELFRMSHKVSALRSSAPV